MSLSAHLVTAKTAHQDTTAKLAQFFQLPAHRAITERLLEEQALVIVPNAQVEEYAPTSEISSVMKSRFLVYRVTLAQQVLQPSIKLHVTLELMQIL